MIFSFLKNLIFRSFCDNVILNIFQFYSLYVFQFFYLRLSYMIFEIFKYWVWFFGGNFYVFEIFENGILLIF